MMCSLVPLNNRGLGIGEWIQKLLDWHLLSLDAFELREICEV